MTTTPHFRNRTDRLRTYNEGTFKIDGTVTFFYDENGDTEARVTLNTLDEPVYGEGLALLHPDDKDCYVQSFGEQLALTRAMQDALTDAELFLIEQTREDKDEDQDSDVGRVDPVIEANPDNGPDYERVYICDDSDCPCGSKDEDADLDGHTFGPREECGKCCEESVSPALRGLTAALDAAVARIRERQREDAVKAQNEVIEARRATLREAIAGVLDAYKQRAEIEAGD